MSPARRILIAESDVALLAKLEAEARSEGYSVVTTSEGSQVIACAVAHTPELILLDIAYDDADGRDLLAQLKRDPRTTGIPVVVWSARDYDSDRRIALELGAEEYLRKSDSAMLLPRIARVLLRVRQRHDND